LSNPSNLDLKDVKFDKDDLSLYQVDDLQLKADAIRNSILPKLNLLLNYSILRIKQIYDIEVFEDLHITQSPNFRRQRVNDLKVDYKWSLAALAGKRIKEKWHGLIREDSRSVQIIPSEYGFVFHESGLEFILINQSDLKLSKKSWAELYGFLAEHEGIIQSLCYWADVTPIQYSGDGCGPFEPLGKRYNWMIKEEIFSVNRLFESHTLKPPITAEALSALADNFAYFYPVYDSFVQISKGEPIRFDRMVEQLTRWWEKEAETQESDRQTKESAPSISVAKQLADQRIRVMPAMRWQVFRRDGWKCVACGRSADDGVILHIDHIVPRSKGGADAIGNYQTLCNICNLGKSNRDDTDLRK
jgi:hypothetical protein